MIENIKTYMIDKSQGIPGYLGAILIGSEATGYATEYSDIDIHVFVDQTQKRGSIGGEILNNRPININIYPIDFVLQRIESAAKGGSHICKRMYGIQGVILDDPYMIISNIKQTANDTSIQKGYSEQDLRFIIGGFHEFQPIISKLNPYALEKLLFHIFEKFSFIIGYDHYDNFDISYWKNTERLFHDDDYALNHRGMIYQDKEFITLREKAYQTKDTHDIQTLMNYSSEKLISLL